MCIQFGKGPCGIKVVGPTVGFFVTLAVGVSALDVKNRRLCLMEFIIVDCLLASISLLLLLCHRHRKEVSSSLFFVAVSVGVLAFWGNMG